MPHGDIYSIDLGLNEKRENIKESRKQKFVTDSYGMRNDKTDIDEADIILVGDSYITGNGTSQEYIPSNTLAKVSGTKSCYTFFWWIGLKRLRNIYYKIFRKNKKRCENIYFLF